jgi:predicted phosphate transport protein (TIGR00153 family)
MGLIQQIFPREERFFDLFERHSAALVEGAEALNSLLDGGHVAESIERIRTIENRADDLTRDVLIAVRRSFITPFDRSAITALVSAMDDAVDEIWHTAKAVRIYRLSQFEPQMRESAGLAVEAAALVSEALPLMRNIGRNSARLHQITEAIVHLEGRADILHEQGLDALFRGHRSDRPMDFIVGREIYGHIERVLDRLEDVADEIQGIVIDHA